MAYARPTASRSFVALGLTIPKERQQPVLSFRHVDFRNIFAAIQCSERLLELIDQHATDGSPGLGDLCREGVENRKDVIHRYLPQLVLNNCQSGRGSSHTKGICDLT